VETAQATTYELSKSAHPTQPKIVAAIPCFNTECFIGEVVSKAKKYVDQVIVVDDGSHDATAEAAKAAGALVINHGINRGYGESIKSCFEAAKANNADVLITLDGDGQHNPDELHGLLSPILNGEADLVIGSRFLQPRQSLANSPQSTVKPPDSQLSTNNSGLSTLDCRLSTNIPRYRKFGIDVITFLYNFGSKIKVSDAQSGFRAYSKKILDAISLTEKGMGISIEVLAKAREKGFIMKEVPVSCSYHSEGSTMNPVRHGLGVAFTVLKLRFKNLLRRLTRGNNA